MNKEKLLAEVYAQALNPDNFCAAAAEAYAKAESEFRNGYSRDNSDSNLQLLLNLLDFGKAYCSALRQGGLGRDYTSTLLMMILSADMSQVAPARIARQLLELHSAFMMQLAQTISVFDDQPERSLHYRCALRAESAIFLHLFDTLGAEIADPALRAEYSGMAEATRDYLDRPAPEGCLPVAPLDVKTLLIDIVSRFHALGHF